jgi:hypothetical protein
LYVIWRLPSERIVVATSDAFAPPPILGGLFARREGQLAAHAPVHSLVVPESFWNR